MKSILDPTFRYVPAAKTDVAATFARVRKEQRAAEQQQAANETEAAIKVAPLTQQRRKQA